MRWMLLWCVTSQPSQLSFLPSLGWKWLLATGQWQWSLVGENSHGFSIAPAMPHRFLLFPFNGHFFRWTWVSRFHLRSSSYTWSGRVLQMMINGTGFYSLDVLCYLTIHIRELKGTPVACSHPILIHHRTPYRRHIAAFVPELRCQYHTLQSQWYIHST